MGQLHLRRVGVEARPEMVRGSKVVTAVSPSNIQYEATGDPAEDDHGSPVGATGKVSTSEVSEARKNGGGETSVTVVDKSDGSEDLDDDLCGDDGKRSLHSDPRMIGTSHSEGKWVLGHDEEHGESEPELLEML